MKRLTLLPALLCFALTGFSQWPTIGGVTVVPQAPSTSDYVMIITEVTTPNTGNKISQSHQIKSNPSWILARSCYYGGMLTATKTYVDTFMIGKLSAGSYEFRFLAQISSSSSVCQSTDSSGTIKSFTVNTLTDLSKQKVNVKLELFPNPATNYLNVSESSRFSKAEIFAADGRLVKIIEEETIQSLDISDLAPGTYILKLYGSEYAEQTRFIKIGQTQK